LLNIFSYNGKAALVQSQRVDFILRVSKSEKEKREETFSGVQSVSEPEVPERQRTTLRVLLRILCLRHTLPSPAKTTAASTHQHMRLDP